ncbi:flavin reductase family protein [Kallotenue papyrolyticum]|uniref:flavin reductase family protein n=1 Tax=Kallotenue papyrolyticum TaxID=1325125 RepID=UPI0004786107|nr:flavin reductase family protein [Kallotenue papyrolyticum]
MGINEAEFRYALSHFASGVTVVTTSVGGVHYGLTVSSFCSLSLNPPLILVCIDQRAQSHAMIRDAGVFAVNILAEDSAWLSQLFASREPDKFEKVDYRLGQTGAPLLCAALTRLECRLVDQLPGGDHSIFVGEVIASEVEERAGPLLYYRRGYHRLA